MFAISSIASTSTAEAPSPRHQQLQHAAQQFEAVMLGELMKPLQKGSAIGDDTEDASSNSLQSYGVEAMAGALAKSGALGFADTMIRSVEAREEKTVHAEKV